MALKKLTFAQLKKIAYMYAQLSDDTTLVDFVNAHRGSAADRIFELHPNDEPGFLGDVELISETVKGMEASIKAQQKLLKRYQERNSNATVPVANAAANIADSLRQMSISLSLDGSAFGRPPR